MIKKIKSKLQIDKYNYDLKLAILRILGIIILVIIFNYSFNYFSNQNEDYYNAIESDSNINYFKNNSKGDLYSLNQYIFVRGYAKIIKSENMNTSIYLEIKNFEIFEDKPFEEIKNKKYDIFSSMSSSGKGMIPVKNLTIIDNSTLNIHFPKWVSLSKYNYIVFLDKENKIPLAFVEIII